MNRIPDVVTQLQQEMQSDDENQSERLVTKYKEADLDTQNLIDNLMISLCGWGMDSLIDRAIENGYFVGED